MIVAWGRRVVDDTNQPIVPKDTDPKDLEVLLEAYGDVKNYDPVNLQLTANANFQTVSLVSSKIFENTCLKDYKEKLLEALNENLKNPYTITVEDGLAKMKKANGTSVDFSVDSLELNQKKDKNVRDSRNALKTWADEKLFQNKSEHGKLMYNKIIAPFYTQHDKASGNVLSGSGSGVKLNVPSFKKMAGIADNTPQPTLEEKSIYWFANRVFHGYRADADKDKKVVSDHEKCLITIIEDWTALFERGNFDESWLQRARQLSDWD